MLLNNLISLITFFTIIPSTKKTNYDISYIAKNMYLCPLIGIMIGFILSLLSYIIFDYVDGIFFGVIISICIVLITGLHHLDALGDMADGLMVNGDKEMKRRVMSDPRLGTAGTVTIIFYIIILILLFSSIDNIFYLLSAIMVAEVFAKYSMTLQCYLGRSAWDGMNVPFIKAMNSKKIIISSLIMIITFYFFGSSLVHNMISMMIGLAVTLIILAISNKHFGGISGDTIGSSNELTRLSILFVYVFL
ncbi:MAG: adenosylcobinamide-GDP ribazoletransferase [Nitrososphaeraceae archaeon]